MAQFRGSRVTRQDKLLLELKHARDMIQQSQQKIELNLEKERHLANKLKQDGMNEKALQHIKKMQNHEQKLVRLERELEQLEDKIFEIDLNMKQAEAEDNVEKVKENLRKRNKVLGDDRYGNADVTNEVQTDGSSTIWTALVVVFGIVIGVGIALLRSSD